MKENNMDINEEIWMEFSKKHSKKNGDIEI